ncbi:hypothetical protein METBIDRAFT_75888 [Metschnikowia bicuspidata var. bicuspidata NRRL YB-4993]|uniref:Exoribonuclease phosphorolytic domain-containing protein n=1 Tax=Metschnikowia bicuspidata var. bicuspidata NRRL YB-4993 TaxID=869754 RepID=A0A1A0HFL0_9ASCO|nr:hypothetical protein METBIDRAFT_75888 [Metschnikowia bicuspidata var. bicuspidata NRRL YB-4993]OBA22682.1 hypothetical protein METBIDRAFT_75888 [Metschnikowia bicuspidata var. bicuspidata NRRL YB-4993]
MSELFSVSPAGLTEVDGLARLTAGSTTVLVSVSGPIEPKIRQELPTQASLELIVRPSRGVSTTREKNLEDLMRCVLQLVIVRHKYPRQLIQIVVQFLATDVDLGGTVAVSGNTAKSGAVFTANELSAAINCAYFALVDANIALFNSFALVSLAVDSAGHVSTGPPLKALQSSQSHHVICFDIRDRKALKILLVESNGAFDDDTLVSVVEAASEYCETVHAAVQRPFVEKLVAEDFVWAS